MDASRKTIGASERDKTARIAHREQVASEPVERFGVVDECGNDINLTPRYGRAPRGERVYGQVATQHDAHRRHDDPRDGASDAAGGGNQRGGLRGDIEHFLLPQLRAGQIVVLDNLSAHQSERVHALLDERGCQHWFLPPYSPDLFPIEETFSKLKHLLRRAEARTREALEAAIGEALHDITASDATSSFNHCGYNVQAQ